MKSPYRSHTHTHTYFGNHFWCFTLPSCFVLVSWLTKCCYQGVRYFEVQIFLIIGNAFFSQYAKFTCFRQFFRSTERLSVFILILDVWIQFQNIPSQNRTVRCISFSLALLYPLLLLSSICTFIYFFYFILLLLFCAVLENYLMCF